MVMLWLYPRLREVRPEAWESTLSSARDADLETAEWVGIIGGIALVAWLLGSEHFAFVPLAPFILHLLRFVLALPLLALVVGPIYLRRNRRGLDRVLARMDDHTRNGNVLSRGKEP